MTSAQVTVVLAAAVSSGLLAGLFYSFSCAVLPGLARTDDDVFVATMTAINRAIGNGWFALSFFGGPLLSVLSRRRDPCPRGHVGDHVRREHSPEPAP